MSTNSTKILTGIVIVVVVIVLGRWWYVSRQVSPTAMDMATSTDMTDMSGMNMAGAQATGQTSQNTAKTAGTVSANASGNSDAALNQDVNNIDGQMNGLNSDNASADQGINNPNQ